MRGTLDRLARDSAADIAAAAEMKVKFANLLTTVARQLTPAQKSLRDEILDRAIADYREALAKGWRDEGALRVAALLKSRAGYELLLAEAESVASKPGTPPAASDIRAKPEPGVRMTDEKKKLDIALMRATAQAALAISRALVGVDGEAFTGMEMASAASKSWRVHGPVTARSRAFRGM